MATMTTVAGPPGTLRGGIGAEGCPLAAGTRTQPAPTDLAVCRSYRPLDHITRLRGTLINVHADKINNFAFP